jgi:purine nucleoside phosphorylase
LLSVAARQGSSAIGERLLVSLSACGSFKAELPPGTFVLIDQFVDRTHACASSFFGAGCVAHVSMAHPVSPRLRIHLAEAARVEGIHIVPPAPSSSLPPLTAQRSSSPPQLVC